MMTPPTPHLGGGGGGDCDGGGPPRAALGGVGGASVSSSESEDTLVFVMSLMGTEGTRQSISWSVLLIVT